MAWTDSGGEVVITQSKPRSRRSRSARERANGIHAATSASGTRTLLSGCGLPLYVGSSNIAPIDFRPASRARSRWASAVRTTSWAASSGSSPYADVVSTVTSCPSRRSHFAIAAGRRIPVSRDGG